MNVRVEGSFGGRYEILRSVNACIGGSEIWLGTKGLCRFCGSSERATFKDRSHTVPEALGNKWVFSLDECDSCNARFSAYDDALAASVAPFLTLGGVQGKRKSVRQIGRTNGPSVIKKERTKDGQRLSFQVNEAALEEYASINLLTRRLKLTAPLAPIRFRPRHAYKALCKIALAIMPLDELRHYTKLRQWLLNKDDTVEFPCLDVGLSFGSVGNSPAAVSASLMRRCSPVDPIPYIVSMVCAGSTCFQIELMSDYLEDHLPPTRMGSVNIRHRSFIGADSSPIEIDYGTPVHVNWSSNELTLQPVEAIDLEIDPATGDGALVLRLRTT